MKRRTRILAMLLSIAMVLTTTGMAAPAPQGTGYAPAATDGVDHVIRYGGGDWTLTEVAEDDTEDIGTENTLYGTTGEVWKALLPASDAGQMSSFSSIGPAPNLSMKPEIAAPGGNILSAVNGNAYESMSGTSMATPHLAGAAALVRNYVRSTGVTDNIELLDITEGLLMGTAVPGKHADGSEFSPREQGAGMVNVKNAVTSAGYLTIVGGADRVSRPKAELGSSATGSFRFSFKLHNLTDEAQTYKEVTQCMTF